MKELMRVKHEIFNEFYEGKTADGKNVVCVLDTNCVRYTVLNSNGKLVRRREYDNSQREACFANATKALNNHC